MYGTNVSNSLWHNIFHKDAKTISPNPLTLLELPYSSMMRITLTSLSLEPSGSVLIPVNCWYLNLEEAGTRSSSRTFHGWSHFYTCVSRIYNCSNMEDRSFIKSCKCTYYITNYLNPWHFVRTMGKLGIYIFYILNWLCDFLFLWVNQFLNPWYVTMWNLPIVPLHISSDIELTYLACQLSVINYNSRYRNSTSHFKTS